MKVIINAVGSNNELTLDLTDIMKEYDGIRYYYDKADGCTRDRIEQFLRQNDLEPSNVMKIVTGEMYFVLLEGADKELKLTVK